MPIDSQMYRARIGIFQPPPMKKGTTLNWNQKMTKSYYALVILSILLLRAGIESNPGPSPSSAEIREKITQTNESALEDLGIKKRGKKTTSGQKMRMEKTNSSDVNSTSNVSSDESDSEPNVTAEELRPFESTKKTVRSPQNAKTTSTITPVISARAKRPRSSPLTRSAERRGEKLQRRRAEDRDDETQDGEGQISRRELNTELEQDQVEDLKVELSTMEKRIEVIEVKLRDNTMNMQADMKRLLEKMNTLEKEITDLKQENKKKEKITRHSDQQDIQDIKKTVEDLARDLGLVSERHEALDNYTRRESLILKGLPQKNSKGKEDEEAIVRELMMEVGMENVEKIAIQAVHPLSVQSPGRRKPPTITKFIMRHHRDELFAKIIKSRLNLTNHPLFSNVTVQPSLSKLTIEKKNKLMPHFQFLKAKGEFCTLRDANLKVNNTLYTIDNRTKEITPSPPWKNDPNFITFIENRSDPSDWQNMARADDSSLNVENKNKRTSRKQGQSGPRSLTVANVETDIYKRMIPGLSNANQTPLGMDTSATDEEPRPSTSTAELTSHPNTRSRTILASQAENTTQTLPPYRMKKKK